MLDTEITTQRSQTFQEQAKAIQDGIYTITNGENIPPSPLEGPASFEKYQTWLGQAGPLTSHLKGWISQFSEYTVMPEGITSQPEHKIAPELQVIFDTLTRKTYQGTTFNITGASPELQIAGPICMQDVWVTDAENTNISPFFPYIKGLPFPSNCIDSADTLIKSFANSVNAIKPLQVFIETPSGTTLHLLTARELFRNLKNLQPERTLGNNASILRGESSPRYQKIVISALDRYTQKFLYPRQHTTYDLAKSILDISNQRLEFYFRGVHSAAQNLSQSFSKEVIEIFPLLSSFQEDLSTLIGYVYSTWPGALELIRQMAVQEPYNELMETWKNKFGYLTPEGEQSLIVSG